jgi:hypothetical protein
MTAGNDIVVTRVLDAPRSLVFKAWSTDTFSDKDGNVVKPSQYGMSRTGRSRR